MILILTETYPSSENIYAMGFVHTRVKGYLEKGLKPIILSFRAEKDYGYDGVTVITEKTFFKKYNKVQFKLVLSHAPNLKNHLRFLTTNKKKYKKILLFFHGHEVLRKKEYYPKPYRFVQKNIFLSYLDDSYDLIKLKTLKKFILKRIKKKNIELVFVSKWMYEEFIKNLKISRETIEEISHVIPNSVNPVFLSERYTKEDEKKADFITIRPLDKSKYGVDIVVELAKLYPTLTFHVYGVGEYFRYNQQPDNLTVFNKFIAQKEIPKLLNFYRAALMPTRLDAQGVMACEMASYNIPLVTSDIPICKEVFKGFKNVYFINNKQPKLKADAIFSYECCDEKNQTYSEVEIINKEVKLINELSGN